MRKTFFLFLIACSFLTVACSSDDDSGNNDTITSEARLTLDGTNYAFNTFNINRYSNTAGENDLLEVTATIDGNPEEFMQFSIYENITGSGQSIFADTFRVNVSGVPHYVNSSEGTVTFNITRNDGERIEGTFSGTVRVDNSSETKQITNGVVSITL